MVTQPTPYAMPSWAKYGYIVRRPFCPPSIRSSFFNRLRSHGDLIGFKNRIGSAS